MGLEDVFPWFIRSERNSRGPSAWHGDAGPLQVTDQVSPNPATRAFVEAARSIGSGPMTISTGRTRRVRRSLPGHAILRRAQKGERCSRPAPYSTR